MGTLNGHFDLWRQHRATYPLVVGATRPTADKFFGEMDFDKEDGAQQLWSKNRSADSAGERIHMACVTVIDLWRRCLGPAGRHTNDVWPVF
jgi:hypothetical protein